MSIDGDVCLYNIKNSNKILTFDLLTSPLIRVERQQDLLLQGLEKQNPGADKWSEPTVKERSNQDDPIRIRIRAERLQCDAWSSDRLQSAASSVQSVGQKSRPQNEDEITIPGRREASRWQTSTFN
jgi:hypothetical protein